MRFMIAHWAFVFLAITSCAPPQPHSDLDRLYDAFVKGEALWCREYEYIAVDAGVSPYRMCEYRRADSVTHAAWDAHGALVYLTGGWPVDSALPDAVLPFRTAIDSVLGTGVRSEDPDHPDHQLVKWIKPALEVELAYLPREQRVELGARVVSDTGQ